MSDHKQHASGAILELDGLTVSYGAGPVVHGVSLSMEQGSVAGLLGASRRRGDRHAIRVQMRDQMSCDRAAGGGHQHAPNIVCRHSCF